MKIKQILKNLTSNMSFGDKVVITMDINSSKETLLKAYNNSHAKRLVFNSIEMINQSLGDVLDLDLFELSCEWDRKDRVVKFYLSSSENQHITLNSSKITIEKNKRYNIVNSYKFYQLYFEKILSENGLNVLSCFTEKNKRMAVYVCQYNKA